MTSILKLTRPDGSPIWFGGGFVIDTFPRDLLGPAPHGGMVVNTMVMSTRVTYAGVSHYVEETPQQVVELIKAFHS